MHMVARSEDSIRFHVDWIDQGFLSDSRFNEAAGLVT